MLFKQISLRSQMKLWNTEDGRCVEHIRTNLKHRSAQVREDCNLRYSVIHGDLSQYFNYQLTNEHFLICCGCYSEIHIYDMRTLEVKFTLTPSHIDADWISTFFIFQKPSVQSMPNECIA